MAESAAPQQPASPVKPMTVEQRISAAIAESAPPPVETPQQPTEAENEAVRETPERQDPVATAPAEAQDGAATGEPEDGGESAGGGEEGGEDTVEIGTLSELAAHIGVEVEDLYHITVPISVGDGKEEVSIGEWKDRVKAGADIAQVAKEREQFAEEQKAVAQDLATKRAQAEQGIATAAALTQAAEKRLTEDMESIDWAALRESDPAEWSAKRTELKGRQEEIQQAKSQLVHSWQQHAETQKAQFAEQMVQHIERERDSLLEAVPTWKDQKAFDAERSDMRKYLLETGFSDQDIEQAVDHRLIVMARKAMLYDRAEGQKSLARKKVAKIGKRVIAPGATTGKRAALEDVDSKLRAAHRKAGKVDTAAELIAARMKRR